MIIERKSQPVDIDVQRLLFEFMGGLGIFLLGIKFMGEGLPKIGWRSST